jgi:hypothetical protein
MSWGIRITILYLGFVAIIVSLVVIAMGNKHDLVAKDYYYQELKYQDRIDALANEKNLKVSIVHEIQSYAVILSFPGEELKNDFSGEVLFFRPSDAAKDLKLPLKFDRTGKQRIDKTSLTKGIYKMCITWTNGNKIFYKEEIINI